MKSIFGVDVKFITRLLHVIEIFITFATKIPGQVFV